MGKGDTLKGMPSTLIAPKTIVASVGSAEESPSTVRCRALISPALRGRLPALELGLTDPSASVRLVAASQMARLLEHRFQEGGLAPVIAWLSTSVSQPRLFFKERDPHVARQLADELCAVVGVFVTVRLPPLATGG